MESFALLMSLVIALIYSESIFPFLYAIIITIVTGAIFYYLGSTNDRFAHLQKRDALISVTISWLVLGVFGSLPYIFSGSIATVIDSLFESISGFTTTGSSILTDIEILPKSILFWRSLTHWIGGIGIIVLFVIIVPELNIGGKHLFGFESSLQEKFKPTIKSLGNRLLLIYVTLTAAESILLILGGMSLFDSICHSFGTVATGGFSTKNTSIILYSPYIQYVITIFMLLAGINFSLFYLAFKGEIKTIFKNEELKFYLLVIGIIGLITTVTLFAQANYPLESAFRHGFFQIVSIITCTGFATDDYLLWPNFLVILVFFALFIGGSTGSTSGGIKMSRHLILLKNLSLILNKLIHPKVFSTVKLNNKSLTYEENFSVLIFIFYYLILFILSSIIIIAIGVDMQTSTSAVATCMAGIGPGIGTVGPVSNFALLPDTAKLILSVDMIAGRLELLPIFILVHKNFWKV
jgi:trk system potassium uptake protein